MVFGVNFVQCTELSMASILSLHLLLHPDLCDQDDIFLFNLTASDPTLSHKDLFSAVTQRCNFCYLSAKDPLSCPWSINNRIKGHKCWIHHGPVQIVKKKEFPEMFQEWCRLCKNWKWGEGTPLKTHQFDPFVNCIGHLLIMDNFLDCVIIPLLFFSIFE